MNESARTGVYAGLAAVSLLVAFAARPATPDVNIFKDQGERFFESADPLDRVHEGLARLNDSRSAVAAYDLMQEGLADTDFRLGIQGIFTEPRN